MCLTKYIINITGSVTVFKLKENMDISTMCQWEQIPFVKACFTAECAINSSPGN